MSYMFPEAHEHCVPTTLECQVGRLSVNAHDQPL